MTADPKRITRSMVRAAYDALGLDPALYQFTGRVKVEPDVVTIERIAVSVEGRPLFIDGAPETETTELEVEDDDE